VNRNKEIGLLAIRQGCPLGQGDFGVSASGQGNLDSAELKLFLGLEGQRQGQVLFG
jgi:hypothetical protein